jgi:signal transduction histidine kinase
MRSGDIYGLVFENARIGLLLLESTTGRVMTANAAFLRMAACGCNEVVGLNFWEPPLIADAGAGAEVHQHLCAGAAVEGVELPFETGDGRWLLVEISGSLVGGLILLEVQDATAREQARLADRMETLRLLAGRTAGEFQNLHGTLRMMGELLLANTNRDRPVLRALEEVQQACDRSSTITGQLLAFSGEAKFQAQSLALNDLLESMLPRLRQLFGREIEIVCDLSPDLEPVMADPTQVRQIILKLAANSAEAMWRGGTFCVQTRNGSGDAPYAMLAISDNGPGFDDQSWAHVFEPFSSTKTQGQGLGLGLAAVHGMVRQSGGRLWVYSRPGKGAAFRIYLPQAGAHFPAAAGHRGAAHWRHYSAGRAKRWIARRYGGRAQKKRLPCTGSHTFRGSAACHGSARTAGSTHHEARFGIGPAYGTGATADADAVPGRIYRRSRLAGSRATKGCVAKPLRAEHAVRKGSEATQYLILFRPL